MKRIIWFLQITLLYLFSWLLSLVPLGQIRRAGTLVGRLMAFFLGKRQDIAVDNIKQSLPVMGHQPGWQGTYETAEAVASHMFRHLGTSLVETCRLYHGRGDDLFTHVTLVGREHYEQAHAQGKGVIFCTGHCGNWELLALAFHHFLGGSTSVVARRQDNPWLNSMVERMRSRYHNQVIYKVGATRAIIKVLKQNGEVGILADQAVFPDEGALIEVFGRTAWASKAPVVIARKTGAALIPIFIHREGLGHVITMLPPYQLSGDISEEGIIHDTQQLSRYLEQFVAAHPADWYWVHRRWKRAGEPVNAPA